MVNTPSPDAVRVAQPNARKRKSPPRDEDDEGSERDEVRGASPSAATTFDLPSERVIPGGRRKLSIDVAAATVAAAAAAASQCYREDTKAIGSSPRSPPSSSLSTSSRPSKYLRLSAPSPTSVCSPTDKAKRKLRLKELASKRRLFRLYKRRIAAPYSLSTFRFPLAGLSYNAPSPAHTLGHPSSSSPSSLSFNASSSTSSSPSPSPTTFSPTSAFIRGSSPAVTRTKSSGPGPSRGCLHQSCVAFRFASMMDGVHLSSLSTPQVSPTTASPTRSGPIYVPPILPPINRYTLQELDLDAIMKNPQLRHDLLFDVGLQFRPTDSKRKRETTDMYWCAIKSELEAGCSCISFDELRRMHRHVCHCPSNVRNSSKFAPESKAHLPCEDALPIRVPSRIRPLIEELREVILAVVLPPNPPVPIRPGAPGTHSHNHALRPRRLAASDQAGVAWLHEAFDVLLVEQQLRHGVFDPAKLFVAVGDLLKKHCAPARDAMVRTMVEIAAKCGPGKEGSLVDALAAIRMCFELLEYMRLDLANHLLSHLRPHLLATAPQFEWTLFSRRNNPEVPVARTWFKNSFEKISASSELHQTVGKLLPSPDQVKALPSVQKIVATVLPALVDLVLFPPAPTPSILPPSPTTTPVTKGHQTQQVTVLPGYPETLYLDHSRLLMLTADASDITANFMLLSMFRQFVYASPSKDGKRISVDDEDLIQLRRELVAVGPSRPGVCFCKDYGWKDDVAQPQNQNAHSWRNAMSSVTLHLAQQIEKARAGQKSADMEVDTNPEDTSRSFVPPDADLVQSVSNWCSSHMHSSSAVSAIFRKKVALAVLKVVIPRFFSLWNAGVQQRLGQSQDLFATENRFEQKDDDLPKTKTGLEPLSAEVSLLAERLAKLAVLHLRVYFPFYEQSGFLHS